MKVKSPYHRFICSAVSPSPVYRPKIYSYPTNGSLSPLFSPL